MTSEKECNFTGDKLVLSNGQPIGYLKELPLYTLSQYRELEHKYKLALELIRELTKEATN